MRLIISGDRDWKNIEFIEQKFLELKNLYPAWEQFIIIQGGSPTGVDPAARSVAKKYKIECLTFRPNYDKYGMKTAPLIRNTKMLSEGKPNIIWVFFPNIDKSEIFQDLIEKAKKRKIPVTVFQEQFKREKKGRFK